jgi:hypothetical protein
VNNEQKLGDIQPVRSLEKISEKKLERFFNPKSLVDLHNKVSLALFGCDCIYNSDGIFEGTDGCKPLCDTAKTKMLNLQFKITGKLRDSKELEDVKDVTRHMQNIKDEMIMELKSKSKIADKKSGDTSMKKFETEMQIPISKVTSMIDAFDNDVMLVRKEDLSIYAWWLFVPLLQIICILISTIICWPIYYDHRLGFDLLETRNQNPDLANDSLVLGAVAASGIVIRYNQCFVPLFQAFIRLLRKIFANGYANKTVEFQAVEQVGEEGKYVDPDVCPLCLEDWDEKKKEQIRLPCHHLFHKECLAKWANTGPKKTFKCPFCQTDLNAEFFKQQ